MFTIRTLMAFGLILGLGVSAFAMGKAEGWAGAGAQAGIRSSHKSPTSTGDQPELQLRRSPQGRSPATQWYNPKELGIDKLMPMKQRRHGNTK